MIYLSKEELVRNIADRTERTAAIIGHTDFSSPKLNPCAVIVPSLGNVVDSALIVIALENTRDDNTDCHRNALRIVMASTAVKATTKEFVRKMASIREKYAFDAGERKFDPAECLDFLNAYDCFMFDFIKTSSTVSELNGAGETVLSFSSLRNMVEKLLKKAAPAENTTAGCDPELLKQVTLGNETIARLLTEILEENRRLNERVNRLTEIVGQLREEK